MNRWYHPEFESDLISAALYYEAQRADLGHEFITTAEQTVEAIMSAPARWPERQAGIRRLQLDRFPFLIRYRITADTVQFLSILHRPKGRQGAPLAKRRRAERNGTAAEPSRLASGSP